MHWRALRQEESGVSMVQFVLAFPIFMMFVVVIIDVGRITALSNVIRESMSIGMQSATSVPNLDVDPRGLAPTDYHYLRSKLARLIVEENSLKLIDDTDRIAIDDDAALAAADGPKLYDIVYTEDRIAGAAEQSTYKVAVLLPGECAEVPALGITECNRQTLGTGPADPDPAQPPEFLVKNHPVKLVAFAHFNSFSPWLFKSWQRFEQYGFRQPIPKSPYPTEMDPQPFTELPGELDPGSQEPLGEAAVPEDVPTSLIQDNQNAVFSTWQAQQLEPEARTRCVCPTEENLFKPGYTSVAEWCCLTD